MQIVLIPVSMSCAINYFRINYQKRQCAILTQLNISISLLFIHGAKISFELTGRLLTFVWFCIFDIFHCFVCCLHNCNPSIVYIFTWSVNIGICNYDCLDKFNIASSANTHSEAYCVWIMMLFLRVWDESWICAIVLCFVFALGTKSIRHTMCN